MKKMAALALIGVMVSAMALPVMAEEGKHFTIATDTVFKPFEYTDANGDFVGIDVDLLAAIAEDQGFTYDLNSDGEYELFPLQLGDGIYEISLY